MFACVIDGLPVTTSFQQVEQFKYLLDHPIKNERGCELHVCIFLTGQSPLDAGAAVGIHTAWSPEFSFSPSGFISSDKPSTIFTVTPPIQGNLVLRIGLSIESNAQVVQSQIISTANKSHETARKVAENFHNYVSSFPQAATQGVPLAILDKWFANFEKKLQTNPQFLK